jgi:hypothetical protein
MADYSNAQWNVTAPAPQRMTNDYMNYLNSSKPGDTQQWAGGTLTKGADGIATWTGPTGQKINMTNGSNFDSIAQASPEIRDLWKQTYGFTPAGNSTDINDPRMVTHAGPVDMTGQTPYKISGAASGGLISNAINPPPTQPPAPGSAGTQVGTQAGTATSQPAAKPSIQSDYANYFATSKPGDTTNWAGGTLTRNATGAIYTDASGRPIVMNPDSDLSQIASQSPNIAALWNTTYGFQPKGTTTPAPGSGAATGTSQAAAPSVAPPSYTPPAITIPTPSQSSLSVATDPNQTTEGIINRMLSDGSTYMDANRANAMRAANSRGLMNSSIAATAGEKAAIESALPIAQQDASAYQQNLNTTQQGIVQSALSSQTHAQSLREQAQAFLNQAELYKVQGQENRALQAQSDAAALLRQATAADQTSRQSTQDFNEQSALNTAAFTQETATKNADQAFTMIQKEADYNHDADQWHKDQRDNFGRVTVTLQNQYSQDRVNILTNKDMKSSAKIEALNSLDAFYKESLEFLAATYGVDLDIENLSTNSTSSESNFNLEKSMIQDQYKFPAGVLDRMVVKWQELGKKQSLTEFVTQTMDSGNGWNGLFTSDITP